MKKIPTVFRRDEKRAVVDEVTPGCEWVARGEGFGTRKHDGTCCLVRDGKLYKRHEVKPGKAPPPGFEQVDHDVNTGKTVGWVPVGDGPEDRWHREAFGRPEVDWYCCEGTYELVGPKVQGNPEKYPVHTLLCHNCAEGIDAPRDFEGLREWMTSPAFEGYEGIVWHDVDGVRMAKLKRRDFR